MWAAPGGWHAVRVRRCRARHWTGSFRFWVSGRALSLWGALAPQRAGVSFEADARLQRVGGLDRGGAARGEMARAAVQGRRGQQPDRSGGDAAAQLLLAVG